MNAALSPADRLAAIRAGGKPALARALAAIETDADGAALAALLDAAAAVPAGRGPGDRITSGQASADPITSGHVIGLTGPPGVGKSTLTAALLGAFRSAGDSVGVIAVDPSSRLTGGALLGDRTRIRTDPADAGVFIRSMAARDRLGGLSDHAVAATVLMRALRDRVVVETVGVGQSEGDVATVADTIVLCVQPGSGDSLQFMKAGVMELPDIVVVTKADTGAPARRAAADVAGALSLGPAGRPPPVVLVSAADGSGLADLVAALDAHRADAAVRAARRAAQPRLWLTEAVRSRFGTAGLAATDLAAALACAGGPFAAIRAVTEGLAAKLRA